MKSLRIILVGLLITIATTFAFTAKAAEASLTVSNVTLSWPAVIYRPVTQTPITMTISNNTGRELLYAIYDLKDNFGTRIAYASKVSVPVGTSSITTTWFASDISSGTAPFTLSFGIEYYSSAGIANPAPVSTSFQFTERSAAAPSVSPKPVPTVTVTAIPDPAPTIYRDNPADQALSDLVASLKSQVGLLNSKIKRICMVKPKPKNC